MPQDPARDTAAAVSFGGAGHSGERAEAAMQTAVSSDGQLDDSVTEDEEPGEL